MRGQNAALPGKFDVQVTVALEHAVQTEMLYRALPCRLPKLQTKISVATSSFENGCKCRHIPWLEKPSRSLLFDNLGIATHSGSDHR